MRRRGVLYDVGRVLWVNWRPAFDPVVVRRELQIIRDDLHCNAVKICGLDIDRLMAAAEDALVSPTLTSNDDPLYDLDMASYSLVKSYADKHGTTYPDMPWEPKESFKAVADYFGWA